MAWEDASIVIKFKEKNIPQYYLEALGRELVQIILRRTESGKDKNGKDFVGYSKSYRESDNFLLAGKSQDRVNLRLSGDMLADLGVLYAKNGTLILGFEDEEQRAKAHGHIHGTTSSTGKRQLPVRDFLGISKDELLQAVVKVPPPEELRKAYLKAKNILLKNKKNDYTLSDVIELSEVMVKEADIYD